MKKVTVEFERDLCCHAVGQCLDEIAQHILFFREQIPNLVANILHDETTKNSSGQSTTMTTTTTTPPPPNSRQSSQMSQAFRVKKRREFVTNFNEIRRSLRRIFSTRNDGKITRAALLLGDSPAHPKDAYFVTFEICRKKSDNNDENDENANAEFCRHLDEREFARLARTLVGSDQCPFNNMKRISICKLYVLIEAQRDIDLTETTFLPRPDLNLDKIASFKPNTNIVSIDLRRRRRWQNEASAVELAENLQRVTLAESESECKSQLLWFFCEHPICGLSD